jgi:hypothetical protein
VSEGDDSVTNIEDIYIHIPIETMILTANLEP